MQLAVAMSEAGDTIVIESGSYTETVTLGDITVLIRGAGSGSKPIFTNSSITFDESGNSSRITGLRFETGDSGPTPIIVNGGNSPLVDSCEFQFTGTNQANGAIYADLSDIVISDCWFSTNNQYSGGAIRVAGANITSVTGCIFEGCVSGQLGGAIYINSCNDLTISRNVMNACDGLWQAGAIALVTSADAKIHNNTMANNASGWGIAGALYLKTVTGDVRNNIIVGSNAETV